MLTLVSNESPNQIPANDDFWKLIRYIRIRSPTRMVYIIIFRAAVFLKILFITAVNSLELNDFKN